MSDVKTELRDLSWRSASARRSAAVLRRLDAIESPRASDVARILAAAVALAERIPQSEKDHR